MDKKQRKFVQKFFANQKKLVNESLELSQSMLAELENDIDFHISAAYADKDCKQCHGRGEQHYSHPGNKTLKVLPCDCSIKGRMKSEKTNEIKPLYGIVNRDGVQLVYPSIKDGDKLVVPKKQYNGPDWSKAKQVVLKKCK